MPKVPVTAKRARTVMSQEPLVPDSVKGLAASNIGNTARRSTRLAAATTIAEKPPPAKKAARAKKGRGSEGGGAAEAENGLVAVKEEEEADAKVGNEAVPIKTEEAGGRDEVTAKPKKRRKVVKAEVPDSAERPAVKAAAKKGKAKRQGSGSRDDEEDAEPVPDEGEPAKKPRARRGPTGYAVVGEDVADSPADRRARIKAAKQSGSEGQAGDLPAVLGAEVARMCRELGDDSLGATAPWERHEGAVGGLRWWTGCHTSTSGGMERSVVNAAAIGCRAFAMDTRCKMRWESPPLTEQTIADFKAACRKFGFGPDQILPHGSYLINLASPDPEMAQKGYNGFLTELQRCESLGLSMYNFHPGSTTGLCTHEESMDRIAGFINKALNATKGVTVVLENMSSVGNIVGGRPWHLRYIIDRVEDKKRIGFCLDTCHMFSSGLDLSTVEACKATFKEIDDVVGLQYLKGMHLNDSKTPFDSHRDRHENIGRGSIPMVAFQWIMNNPAFQGIPLIMETPVQEREPPVDYKKSLQHGCICWKDGNAPYGVGTDRRDIMLLNSLVKQPST